MYSAYELRRSPNGRETCELSVLPADGVEHHAGPVPPVPVVTDGRTDGASAVLVGDSMCVRCADVKAGRDVSQEHPVRSHGAGFGYLLGCESDAASAPL